MACCKLFSAMVAIMVSMTAAHDLQCPVATAPKCDKKIMYCTGNNPSSQDVDCGAGYHLKTNAAKRDKFDGNAAAQKLECCDQTKCSGNLPASNDAECAAGTTFIAASGTTNKGTTCCEDVTGKCTGNKGGTGDVTCADGFHLKAAAKTIPHGSGTAAQQTNCCFETKCSGNSPDSHDFECPDGQYFIAASATTNKNNAATCCRDITGMCKGNKGGTGNVDCGANHKLKAGAEEIEHGAGTTEAQKNRCCDATCGGFTCGADWVADAAKSGDVGASDFACCKQILCCGNDQASLDTTCTDRHRKTTVDLARGPIAGKVAKCCGAEVVTGKCSGNSHTDDDVACGSGKVLKTSVGPGTAKGADPVATCCEASCSSFDCGTAWHLVSTAATIVLGTGTDVAKKAKCCSADITGQCRGNTDDTTDVACATGEKEINSAANKDATGSNCCQTVTGKCRGNAGGTGDVACAAGEKEINDQSDKDATGSNCCSAITKRCTGNKVSSENVNCATDCLSDKSACQTNSEAALLYYLDDFEKCDKCCSPKSGGGVVGLASRGAVLSSVALVASAIALC